jgi:signal transduction histidine kinase
VVGKAFDRFVTTRADKGGTGLGLAIVRAVAEAHAGRVELATPGPPIVDFRLYLPLARGARRRAPHAAAIVDQPEDVRVGPSARG